MESIVSFVADKLGKIIMQEAQLLGGVGEQVKQVQTELTNMKCYLRDADSKRRKGGEESKLVETWLNQLRDLAYRIEDAIDTFYLDLEGNGPKDPGFYGKLKHLGHKTLRVPGIHKLAKELGKIQTELKVIFESKEKYGIEPQQDKGSGSGTVILSKRRAAYQDVDESEIFGLASDADIISNLLLNPETPRRAVLTIVGPGGLGKTTLAYMVYNRLKSHFGFDIMLSVSAQYSSTDLVRKMLNKLKHFVPDNQEEGYYVGELKTLLSSRKYLIILDDVWDIKLWDQLQYALPDRNNGSQVLITSRFLIVAISADPKTSPYHPKFLNDEDSRRLLLKKSQPDEEFLRDVGELPDALAKKCKGLPLALIVLGGILSTKDQNYHAWKKVLDTMDWHSEDGQDCTNVLLMSYDDMPYYLKICFLYLALFPEDYEISAKCLIRMWIAEGFIPQEDKKTLEETAEDYLQQLLQRCMVQVSRRSANGLVKYFRVHDLIRGIAADEALKMNFVTIFPTVQVNENRAKVIRRTSLQSCSPVCMEYLCPYSRSLLWFGQHDNLPTKYSQFRYLRVLELVCEKMNIRHLHDFRTLDVGELANFIHLKYLGIRYNRTLNMRKCSFGRLKNLQTLDLRQNKIIFPQTDLWTIDTLRHVYVEYTCPIRELPSTANLRDLQTFKFISISALHKNQFPRLNNLRKLGLTEGDAHNWDVVPYLLGALPSIISLEIQGWNIPEEIIYPKALPSYENLQSLELVGNWFETVTLTATLFPRHLIKLVLVESKLRQDPMLELGKLKSLKKLSLSGEVYAGERMTCLAGFPVLQTLKLFGFPNLKVLTVEKGVMPKLKYMSKAASILLELPPELEHIFH